MIKRDIENKKYIEKALQLIDEKGIKVAPEKKDELILQLRYEFFRNDVKDNIEDYLNDCLLERVKKFLSDDYIIIPKAIFILSNICNLSCESCSALMPKFSSPWEISIQDALFYIENFLRGTDEVIQFNLVGGEPLLYKDLDQILYYLQNHEKVRKISMFTNGTVIPSAKVLEALRGNKVEVMLSDYGDLVKMANFVKTMEENQISFMVRTDFQWIDFGDSYDRKKSIETITKEFRNCIFSRNCRAILKDKFFVCERAARMYMLKAYSPQNDFVILSTDDSDKQIRNKILKMVKIEYAEGCNYCDAGKKEARLITAGVQKNKIKSAYTLISRDSLREAYR